MKRLLLLLLLTLSAWAQELTPVITGNTAPNADAQQQKHYVVLVSLDGFRYDYARKYNAAHLLAIAQHGASAPDGMIPAFPSITFPNHLTLVTGLYPEHHGIIANEFYDPARRAKYDFRDHSKVTDGSWYSGTPLWSLAVKQGMRSACFFWPGSEAEIAGARPTFYLRYDDHFPDEQRVQQILTWLKLPPAERPHFLTLYFSNVDHAGHEFGPDAPEVAAAVHHADIMIGKLEDGLAELHLPVDLIVVSDHGMAAIKDRIDLDQYVSFKGWVTVGDLIYPPSEAAAQQAYEKLKNADPRLAIYRRADVPVNLHFNSNPREGDPVVVARGPFAVRAEKPLEERPLTKGNHGFDPYAMPEMKAIFFAEGPDIRQGVELKPFENVEVYPLIVKLLGLESPPVDGKLNILSGALK
ncbi:MAG TPA: ectonucleotide pyrophosphatase/phosphodiesterase [Candidatus Koribacter sp.]|jgi:alkaline phosphatase D